MPVKQVTKNGKKGWKWGKSGKVYASKSGAQKQARAIYASGYKGRTRKSSRNS